MSVEYLTFQDDTEPESSPDFGMGCGPTGTDTRWLHLNDVRSRPVPRAPFSTLSCFSLEPREEPREDGTIETNAILFQESPAYMPAAEKAQPEPAQESNILSASPSAPVEVTISCDDSVLLVSAVPPEMEPLAEMEQAYMVAGAEAFLSEARQRQRSLAEEHAKKMESLDGNIRAVQPDLEALCQACFSFLDTASPTYDGIVSTLDSDLPGLRQVFLDLNDQITSLHSPMIELLSVASMAQHAIQKVKDDLSQKFETDEAQVALDILQHEAGVQKWKSCG